MSVHLFRIMREVNISKMKKDETYRTCPYCGEEEPPIPGYEQACLELEQYEQSPEYFIKQAELFKDIPIDEWYEVNGKKYPFGANYQHMNDAYAVCNYGVTMWWNEIHCCPKCKKEYYTIHEH